MPYAPFIGFPQAQAIMRHHHQQARQAAPPSPQFFEALSLGINRDGTAFAEWERVPLTLPGIRDWLGY